MTLQTISLLPLINVDIVIDYCHDRCRNLIIIVCPLRRRFLQTLVRTIAQREAGVVRTALRPSSRGCSLNTVMSVTELKTIFMCDGNFATCRYFRREQLKSWGNSSGTTTAPRTSLQHRILPPSA